MNLFATTLASGCSSLSDMLRWSVINELKHDMDVFLIASTKGVSSCFYYRKTRVSLTSGQDSSRVIVSNTKFY